MNILVTHAYSKENKGDAALLSVLLSDIKRAFVDSQVTILTLGDFDKDEKFEGASVAHSFMYFARARYKNISLQIVYNIFLGVGTLLWAVVYRFTSIRLPLPRHLQETVSLYLKADLIIPVGGGYIISKKGFINTIRLYFVLHPLVFAYILGKPTINYTQSIGSFGNAFQEYMTRFTLKKVLGIIVRENISLQILKKWGISKNVYLSADGGFAFIGMSEKDFREELKIGEQQVLVGITVRSWFKPSGQAEYEKSIAGFCDHIIDKYKVVVVFIPQVTNDNSRDDDRESSERVFAYMKHQENARVIQERYDHQTIKALYGKLNYLVGTRFHSVIFALTSFVPAIAIGYDHKTQGVMHDLGLEKWVIPIENTQIDLLIPLFDELVKNRGEYITHLHDVLPSYIERARNSIYLVKQIYEQYSYKDIQ